MANPNYLYRYEVIWVFDTYAEKYEPEIQLKECQIIKKTESGYWVDFRKRYLDEYERKWVKKSDEKSKKRFAYATKKEAWNYFKEKSLSCFERYRNSMNQQKRLLNLIKKHEKDFENAY